MTINAKIKNDDGLTVVIDFVPHSVRSDHADYDGLVKFAFSGDENGFMDLYNKSRYMANALAPMAKHDKVEIQYNQVLFNGEEIQGVISDRTLALQSEGLDVQPTINFLENLMNNPSSRAVNELYKFLEYECLPITDDGCFLAYKAVAIYRGPDITDKLGNVVRDGDYIDVYTKRDYRNNIGDTPNVERNKVDDDPDKGCSHGLHVGSLAYSGPNGSYTGDITVLVKVNPADVVSVPKDYSHQKVRTCRYEVVGEYSAPLSGACYSAQASTGVTQSVRAEPLQIVPNVGDYVEFDYTKNGVTNRRYLYVEKVNGIHLEGTLTGFETDHGDYRCFNRSNVSNLEVLDSDDYQDDDYDEDEWGYDDDEYWDDDYCDCDDCNC